MFDPGALAALSRELFSQALPDPSVATVLYVHAATHVVHTDSRSYLSRTPASSARSRSRPRLAMKIGSSLELLFSHRPQPLPRRWPHTWTMLQRARTC